MEKPVADESAVPVSDGANTKHSWVTIKAAKYESLSLVLVGNLSDYEHKPREQSPIQKDNEFVFCAEVKFHVTSKPCNFGKAGYIHLAEGEKIMVQGPGQGPPVKARGHGYVHFEKFRVWAYYAPESGANKLSVPQLEKELGYSIEFTRDGCTIREASCADNDDDDGSAAAAGKIVSQVGVNSGGSYTIAAIV